MAIALRAAYSAYASAVGSVVVVAGDLIIVGMSHHSTLGVETPTISDNAGGGSNTYSARIPGTLIALSAFAHAWYAIAKASETLTITVAGVGDDDGVSAHVVSGNNQTLGSVQDGSAITGTTAASTDHTSSDITTTNADDYLFIFWYQEVASDTLTENGTSFTKRSEEGTHYNGSFDRVVSSTGNYHDTVTSGTANEFGYILLAFKAAAAGGGGAATFIDKPLGRGLSRGLGV